MLFRPDTSFPFLAIARQFDANYADVLKMAEGYADGSVHIGSAVRIPIFAAIREAVESERERRKLVTTTV